MRPRLRPCRTVARRRLWSGRMLVHSRGVFVRRRLNDAVGWLLLRAAVVLHRSVAGRTAVERLQARRNAALRAAHHRGVSAPELAAGLGLTEGWVRQVLNGRKPPTIEEAA